MVCSATQTTISTESTPPKDTPLSSSIPSQGSQAAKPPATKKQQQQQQQQQQQGKAQRQQKQQQKQQQSGTQQQKGKQQQAGKTARQTKAQAAATPAAVATPAASLGAQYALGLFAHLPQWAPGTSERLSVTFAPTDLHPDIISLGIKMANGAITGSDARCVALLTAFKTVRIFMITKLMR